MDIYFLKPAWLSCCLGDFIGDLCPDGCLGMVFVVFMLAELALIYYTSSNALKLLIPSQWAFGVAAVLTVACIFLGDVQRISVIGGFAMFQFYVVGTCNMFVQSAMAVILLLITYWMFGFGFLVLAVIVLANSFLHKQLLQLISAFLATVIIPLALRSYYHLDNIDAYFYAMTL